MGTSTRMTTRVSGEPNWGKLSGDMTRACNGSTTATPTLSKIVGGFVQSIGGSSKAGRGQSRSVGKAGISAGIRIASFLSDVRSNGFKEALQNTGLGNLMGKSAQDVISYLLNYCAENANTVDEVAARAATAQIFSELFDDEGEVVDMETRLNEILEQDDLNDILTRYFGFYIYEHLSTRFVEKLEQAKDSEKCKKLFNEIKDFIFEKVKSIHRRDNLSRVNWSGNEGEEIIKNIFEDILQIYE